MVPILPQVKGDVGGNYKKMMRYALMEREEFVSHVIDEACRGLGTKESLLIDVRAKIEISCIFQTPLSIFAYDHDLIRDRIPLVFALGLVGTKRAPITP